MGAKKRRQKAAKRVARQAEQARVPVPQLPARPRLTLDSPVSALEPDADIAAWLPALGAATVGELLNLSLRAAYREPGLGRQRVKLISDLMDRARQLLGEQSPPVADPGVPPPLKAARTLRQRLEDRGVPLDVPLADALAALDAPTAGALCVNEDMVVLGDLIDRLDSGGSKSIAGIGTARERQVQRFVEELADIGYDQTVYGPGGLPRTIRALLETALAMVPEHSRRAVRRLWMSGERASAIVREEIERGDVPEGDKTRRIKQVKTQSDAVQRRFSPLAKRFIDPLLHNLSGWREGTFHADVVAALTGEDDLAAVQAAARLGGAECRAKNNALVFGYRSGAWAGLNLCVSVDNKEAVILRGDLVMLEPLEYLGFSADPWSVWRLLEQEFFLTYDLDLSNLNCVSRRVARGVERYLELHGGTQPIAALAQLRPAEFILASDIPSALPSAAAWTRRPIGENSLYAVVNGAGNISVDSEARTLSLKRLPQASPAQAAQWIREAIAVLQAAREPLTGQRFFAQLWKRGMAGDKLLTDAILRFLFQSPDVTSTDAHLQYAPNRFKLGSVLERMLSKAEKPVPLASLLGAAAREINWLCSLSATLAVLAGSKRVIDVGDGRYLHSLVAEKGWANLGQVARALVRVLPATGAPVPYELLAARAGVTGPCAGEIARGLLRAQPGVDCRPDGMAARSSA